MGGLFVIDVSMEVIEEFQVRKSKKQKTNFIEFIQSRFPCAKIENGGFGKNRNIVIGDIEKADVVLGAHYDTCAVLPFPNLIMPRNLFLTIMIQLIAVIIILAITQLISFLVIALTNNIFLGGITTILLCIFILLWLFLGKANKHTMNDNTSGVITLLEILNSLDENNIDKVAFVFFDNEENGLLGSSFFNKKHKRVMENKLLINFDCVSDGDHMMFVQSKKVMAKYGEITKKWFENPDDEKNVLLFKSSTTFYPSDQIHFPYHIGVASLKKNKIFGYYMDKIHTRHDVNFDEKNIDFLKTSILNLLSNFNQF